MSWTEKLHDVLAMLQERGTVFSCDVVDAVGVTRPQAFALFQMAVHAEAGRLMLAVYVDGGRSPAEMRPVRNGMPRLPYHFESIGVTVERETLLSYDLALVASERACHSGSTTEADIPPQGGSNGTSQ